MLDVGKEMDQKSIVFQVDNNEYAIPLESVKAIEKMHDITRVPNASSFIKGVINLRGVIIPIIDLKKRFGLGQAYYTESARIIIITTNGQEVGLIVDAAEDVLDIPKDAIESQPEAVGEVEADFISGVAKLGDRLFILLNIDTVLHPKK